MSKSTRPARRILIASLSLNCWRVNKASFKWQDGPSEVGIPRRKSSLATRKNAGRAWCQEADAVNVHDFPQDAVVRACKSQDSVGRSLPKVRIFRPLAHPDNCTNFSHRILGFTPYETSTTCKKEGKISVKRRILRSITLSRYKFTDIFVRIA